MGTSTLNDRGVNRKELRMHRARISVQIGNIIDRECAKCDNFRNADAEACSNCPFAKQMYALNKQLSGVSSSVVTEENLDPKLRWQAWILKISIVTINRRIEQGMTLENACSVEVASTAYQFKQMGITAEWLEKAKANGVAKNAVFRRVLYGMPLEEAVVIKCVHPRDMELKHHKIAEKNGIPNLLLQRRLALGYPVEQAITMPLMESEKMPSVVK